MINLRDYLIIEVSDNLVKRAWTKAMGAQKNRIKKLFKEISGKNIEDVKEPESGKVMQLKQWTMDEVYEFCDAFTYFETDDYDEDEQNFLEEYFDEVDNDLKAFKNRHKNDFFILYTSCPDYHDLNDGDAVILDDEDQITDEMGEPDRPENYTAFEIGNDEILGCAVPDEWGGGEAWDFKFLKIK